MDAEWNLVTLQDALAALAETIDEIEDAPDEAATLMEALMPTVYAKLNYAWNTRQVGPSAIDTTDHNELVAWPRDLKL
ncbi:hypothetical protein CAI21_02885 [Alkalilimnicola ehrlichii]|uniref:Uncharacterized protein n=1 Tax=Alkalilimnicola ehrlichii TaxID=351052 RepID=A0A3E0X237_9GAMM|nr:hypothetical protein [Alkalilimnicola ehrlichii]RFA30939.1 hypothetical protein CAI21_02885 [Alkalilimnicola ehrlichii]RFA38889.1 hypothetical protein CAL65_03020 [Alkalilimnicola ehrlichii]